MANYTAADIKALRERTGAGMLDVKKALDEAGGDADKALEIIRVKGLKGVAKREGRSTSEGLVAVDIRDVEGGQAATLIELNSETDFVAKNETFINLADRVLQAAAAAGARDADAALAADADGETVQTVIDNTAATLGEKIVLRRVTRVAGERVTAYLHRTARDLPPSRPTPRARPSRRTSRSTSRRCRRRTSRATRSPPRPSRTSAASPRRPRATRASPRPRCRRSSRVAWAASSRTSSSWTSRSRRTRRRRSARSCPRPAARSRSSCAPASAPAAPPAPVPPPYRGGGPGHAAPGPTRSRAGEH